MDLPHCLSGLRNLRKARKISGRQMALYLGLQPNSYSRIESGDRRCYFDKVRVIAQRLNVRSDDLADYLSEDAALALCRQRDNEYIAEHGNLPAHIEPHMVSFGLAQPNSSKLTKAPPPPPADEWDIEAMVALANVPVEPATSGKAPPPPPNEMSYEEVEAQGGFVE